MVQFSGSTIGRLAAQTRIHFPARDSRLAEGGRQWRQGLAIKPQQETMLTVKVEQDNCPMAKVESLYILVFLGPRPHLGQRLQLFQDRGRAFRIVFQRMTTRRDPRLACRGLTAVDHRRRLAQVRTANASLSPEG